MKKNQWRTTMDFLYSLLIFSFGCLTAYLISETRNRKLKTRFSELESGITILQNQNNEIFKQIEIERAKSEDLREKNETLNLSKGELQGRIPALESQIANIQDEKRDLNSHLEATQKELIRLNKERAEFETSNKNLTKQLDQLQEQSLTQANEFQSKSNSMEREIESLKEQRANANAKISALSATNSELNNQILIGNEELNKLKNTLSEKERELNERINKITRENSILTAERSRFETEKKNLESQLEAFNNTLEEIKKTTKTEFQLAAKTILEGNTKEFSENSHLKIGEILNPLKEKLETFEKQVRESYQTESAQRQVLKSEIDRLVLLNQQVTTETNSLTQALKGDSKFQGDWGEMVLERILEAAGLYAGEEYTFSTQSTLSDPDGDTMRPDVIVKLPEDKHIIVDSKVSLTAYSNYFNTTSEQERKTFIKDHIKSIKSHIDDLSKKNYEKLIGVKSPEFVLMFVPIEAAYLLAMREHKTLVQEAWKARIAIVTATTLLTTLKTVASIWKLEKQNKNSIAIAKEAASMYDKFFGLLKDFEKIESALKNGRKACSDAMNKLKDGNGNVFAKMEKLKMLGASPKHQIPLKLIE